MSESIHGSALNLLLATIKINQRTVIKFVSLGWNSKRALKFITFTSEKNKSKLQKWMMGSPSTVEGKIKFLLSEEIFEIILI